MDSLPFISFAQTLVNPALKEWFWSKVQPTLTSLIQTILERTVASGVHQVTNIGMSDLLLL